MLPLPWWEGIEGRGNSRQLQFLNVFTLTLALSHQGRGEV